MQQPSQEQVLSECALLSRAREMLKGQVNTPRKAYEFASTLDSLGYRKQAALIRTAEAEWYYVTNAWYIIDDILTKPDLKYLGVPENDDSDKVESPPNPAAGTSSTRGTQVETLSTQESECADDLDELLAMLIADDPARAVTTGEPNAPATKAVMKATTPRREDNSKKVIPATGSPSAEYYVGKLQAATEWPTIHLFDTFAEADSDAESIDLTNEVYYDYIMANATKRPVPSTFQNRLPRKRTAIDTGVPMDTDTPRTGTGPSTPAARQPLQRPKPPATAQPNSQRPQPPRSNVSQPTGPNPNIRMAPPSSRTQAPRVTIQDDPAIRADSVILPADVLADQKGRELSTKACRDIRIDGIKEASVVIQAVKTCCAGHILGDNSLVDRGKEMARRIDAVTRRMSNVPSSGGPGSATAQAANFHSLASQDIYISSEPKVLNHTDYRASKYSVCKANVSINGYDTVAVIDSGASHSVITRDCAKKAGLKDFIIAKKVTFLNVDGRSSVNKGYLKKVPIAVGRLSTTINATVCDALNYDVLLGSDFFGPHGIMIDYGAAKLHYQLDDDIKCTTDICFGGNTAYINLAHATDSDSDSSLVAETYLLEPVEYEPEHPEYDYDGADSDIWGGMGDTTDRDPINEEIGGKAYFQFDGYENFDSFEGNEGNNIGEDDSVYDSEGNVTDLSVALTNLRDHVDFPMDRLPCFLTQGVIVRVEPEIFRLNGVYRLIYYYCGSSSDCGGVVAMESS
eukprot:jgi/Chrzof1/2036/UNPLg00692.t1